MKLKSPKEPIILSEKSYSWLEKMLKDNEKRSELSAKEKELVKDVEVVDVSIKQLMNGF